MIQISKKDVFLSDYLDFFCRNYLLQEGGAVIFLDVSKLGLGFLN